MVDDPRVDELLEELLDSGGTPEDVCRAWPELLPRVRAGWQRLRAVECQIGALFPESTADGMTPPPPGGELPRIRGYEVQAVLGCGGMGVVYKAWHSRLHRPVALKMLVAGAYARPDELERFLREAEAVAGLRHPNIVQVHDVGDLDGRPYFTMEYIEGGSLARKIAGMPQEPRHAAALVAILAEAIHVAHRSGIVHRDLKPGNILLTADGTPKITDFGLARRMDESGELTVSGAALGTPRYMAPEQAEGKRHAIGPATDVYALGAILYELLTGRPPFLGDTAFEIKQRVIARDPVPPSRLNSHVPRDLETICLKCLQKDPARRYASALVLADDLQRFGRGEPIAARPVGSIERGLRWLRRRPALATAMAAGVLFALTLAGLGIRSYRQRSEEVRAAVAIAENELGEATELRRRYEFASAAAVLQRARGRLGDDGPAGLRQRLEWASHDLDLVQRLDAIRLRRTLVLTAVRRPILARRPGDGPPPARLYEEAFRDAGLATMGDDPASVASRVAASPVRGALVDALDDWASCDADRDRRAWILAVARLADPDPWRDRVRDPAAWDDVAELSDLAAAGLTSHQPTQFLVVLARRLRESGGRHWNFVKAVHGLRPGDFWANVELAYTLYSASPKGAIDLFRTARRMRPSDAAIVGGFAVLCWHHGELDNARSSFRLAANLAPSEPWVHNGVGMTAFADGRREAVDEIRQALRLDPGYASAHANLALILEAEGRPAEALEECRQAIRLDPDGCAAKSDLQGLMLRLGRGDEWRRAWGDDLAADRPRHDAWSGYAELCLFLGAEAEYRRARRALLARFRDSSDPMVALRTARACLLLPAPEDESRQAADLIDSVMQISWQREYRASRPEFEFAHGLAEYRRGRFDSAIQLMEGPAAAVAGPSARLVASVAEHQQRQPDRARKALAAAVLSFDWSRARADNADPAWIAHVLRREAESLILPQWPAFLEGKYRPLDNDERLALLGLCQFHDLRGAEAGLLEAAFAADPQLAKDLSTGLRLRAARAAAVAGSGGGADGARLGDEERARWRKRARDWLRAEVEDWASRPDRSPAADRATAERTLASWRADPDLASLCDPRALDRWPAAERQECLALWSDVAARIERILLEPRHYLRAPSREGGHGRHHSRHVLRQAGEHGAADLR